MGMDAVHRAAAMLMACNKQLIEAARRLLMRGGGRRSHHKPATMTCAVLGRVDKRKVTKRTHPAQLVTASSSLAPASAGSGELWQRSILMGEKCDPINFSGAIFYDCNGRRLSGAPPRSPRHVLGSPRAEGNRFNNNSPLLPLPPGAASPKWIAGY